MTPLQVARNFDIRDGFDLVDFAEVGLPVFRLTVEAVTLARQEMPTTHEFVLRAIAIGEERAPGIAHLLGLSEDVVIDALNILAYDGLVATVQPGYDHEANPIERYEVTEIGLDRLNHGERTPRDEVLVFDYDGIRRRPIRLANESILRPKELAERSAIQIRPYPAEPPLASEVSLIEVARAVRRVSGKDFERGVLAVRRIIRRDNLFRPAIGLAFQSRTTDELQIGFVLNDQLAEDYEIEFSRHGGSKKPGILRAAPQPKSDLRRFLGPELSSKISDGDDVIGRRREVAIARRDRATLGAKLERLRRRPKLANAEQEDFAEVDARLRTANDSLNKFELRALTPYEQWELLSQALDEAEKRLYISSTNVDPNVTNRSVLRKMNDLLDEGVHIRIETNSALSAEPKEKVGSFEPGVELWLLAQRSRLTLENRNLEVGEVFLLIKDADLAVVSNRPFLCSRERPLCFLPTVGIVSRNPMVVAEISRLAGLVDIGRIEDRRNRGRG
ncbi:phospholipase D-like domain-containing protein [Aminobacter niigataensis]|uniref:hypothetical protein n=1 Tax=Aminobacter niigataensis TaxID=83265 RepID=UPI0024CA16A2|nr:hypothetical protein [Aminobacter niigataensis]CAI2931895.1 conserved protein of unknown function [Aminobacter niigataensis]